MLITGAKGFAKELFQILNGLSIGEPICFYDDINEEIALYGLPIVKNINEATAYFKNGSGKFALGAGGPLIRKRMYEKFIAAGGNLSSVISEKAVIGEHDVNLGEGCCIFPNVAISNGTRLGKGCIVYYNTVITHDCEVGEFVEISPAAVLLGRCKVGAFTHIGANATILPDVLIGTNVKIGAGAVVTKNVADNSVVAGVPAHTIKQIAPLNF